MDVWMFMYCFLGTAQNGDVICDYTTEHRDPESGVIYNYESCAIRQLKFTSDSNGRDYVSFCKRDPDTAIDT